MFSVQTEKHDYSGMKWIENYHVSPHDTDINGIVRPSPVLRYLQETANLQLHNLGPSNEYLREKGMAFILSRISMRLYAPLFPYDKISVQSWACESRLSSFYRCGRIFRGKEMITELMSVWALVDTADRHIYKTSAITVPFETDEMLNPEIFLKIRIPRETEFIQTGERRIGYGDADINFHMNNTNYPDMFCDAAGDMTGRRVTSLSINFFAEAQLGEKIKILTANDGETYYYRTTKEDGTVGAEAIFEIRAF